MKNLSDWTSWGISIEDIPPEGISLNFEDLAHLGEDLKIVIPFSGTMKIKKVGLEIEVEGFLSGSIELSCDRCLETFAQKIEEDFKVTIVPKQAIRFEDEKELESKELEISFYEGDFLSFYDIIREEILLALPFRKLCQTDCKGLCPKCGTNLNLESCDCKIFRRTSPFAVLGDILKKGENTVIKEG
ncbi:MAG: DUF177 domain-containing protein [Caldimicrobium sp.]|nr:DUF177 domain-containing protein [Caldimicrobium sp.]MCX7613312.1 DUF177 domain-containing protein [Caldimicrobium sp.]MDW8183407.1 DUF177 domain-containing protein [Caldimicrobium sp.]